MASSDTYHRYSGAELYSWTGPDYEPMNREHGVGAQANHITVSHNENMDFDQTSLQV